MDRKICILLYSKYSQACRDLLKYIDLLPSDFPSITGLSMLSVDSKEAKDACNKLGIKGVPVLLIEYFFAENPNMIKKQMLEMEQIYQWVDEVVKTILHNKRQITDLIKSDESNNPSTGVDTAGVTFLDSSTKSDVLPMLQLDTSSFGESSSSVIENEIKTKSSSKPMSAAAIAAEMEQQRKREDEKFTTSIKKNKFSDSN